MEAVLPPIVEVRGTPRVTHDSKDPQPQPVGGLLSGGANRI